MPRIPKTMRAAVKTAQGDFEIWEVPVPEITQPNFVLARVKAAGRNLWK